MAKKIKVRAVGTKALALWIKKNKKLKAREVRKD